jgi:heme exporter protein A
VALASLTVDRLTCLRGGRLVFRGLRFALSAGQALSLEGANGTGKSSLLRMLAGFLAPASGTIAFVEDSKRIEEGEERTRFVGWLGHLDAAKPQMSVDETLAFYSAFYGRRVDRATIATTLESVGIAKLGSLSCQYLSAGQKKRLALARLKLTARPLWLMDEPFAALDAQGKAIAARLISEHCAGGGLAVIATHEPLGIVSDRLVLGDA